MDWSKYQLEIFKHTELGERSILVQASAGSGKTTSLIAQINYLDDNLSWFLTSFGNKIVDTLKNKAPPTKKGEIKTFHSFGLKCLYKTFGQDITVDNDKTLIIIDKTIGKKLKSKELPWQLAEAVRKCKLTLSSSKEEITNTINQFDIDLCDLKEDEFVNYVSFLLNLSKKYSTVVDMEDMVWLHHVVPTKIQQFDRVFLDEYQDFSKCEVEFAFKIVKDTGKCYAYGDAFQGIYYWRSADPESFNSFKNHFNPLVLSLPISYRCPIKIIKEAQRYNPDIEASDQAIEGEIHEISVNEMYKLAGPNCFILSRWNAPMVEIAMKLIAQKRPCAIQGRDLGENLLNIIKRSRAKSIEKFLEYLEKWKKKEVSKAMAHKKDSSNVMDKYQCLLALSKGSSSLEEMKRNIDKLFYDGDEHQKIVCSSIHKAKGLERPAVFLLKWTLRSNNQEELNCVYTAITRSAGKLYYVKSDKKSSKQKLDDKSDDSTDFESQVN